MSILWTQSTLQVIQVCCHFSCSYKCFSCNLENNNSKLIEVTINSMCPVILCLVVMSIPMHYVFLTDYNKMPSSSIYVLDWLHVVLLTAWWYPGCCLVSPCFWWHYHSVKHGLYTVGMCVTNQAIGAIHLIVNVLRTSATNIHQWVANFQEKLSSNCYDFLNIVSSQMLDNQSREPWVICSNSDLTLHLWSSLIYEGIRNQANRWLLVICQANEQAYLSEWLGIGSSSVLLISKHLGSQSNILAANARVLRWILEIH